MTLLLSIALTCPQAITAEGLRPGEHVVALAPTPTLDAPASGDDVAFGCRAGRVIDAFTGYPVPNATVETWTEEINRHYGGFHRIGEASSGRDGRFVVRHREGTHTAEKARVRAASYVPLSTTVSGIFEPVLLFPAEPDARLAARMRIVDALERPIAGARITTTYSCAHDVPAFEVASGADGVAELADLGLQDDVPDLRLRAAGYRAIKYLGGEPLCVPPPGGGTWTVARPRCDPLAFRLVGDDGAPWPDAPVYVLDGDGYHVVRTDADGVGRVPSRYGRGALALRVLDAPENRRFVGEIMPPGDGRVPTVRRDAEDVPEGVPTGTVRVDWGDARIDAADAYVQIVHEDGWTVWLDRTENGLADAAEVPAGKAYLLVGAPFGIVERTVVPFELAAGDTVVLRPRVELQPEIRIEVLEPDRDSVWVEAGGVSRIDVPLGEPFAVPARGGLTIGLRDAEAMAGAPHGVVVLHRVPSFADGETIDLRGLQRELRAAHRARADARPRVRRTVRPVAEAGGAVLDDVTVSADGLAGPGVLEGAAGTPWLVRCAGPGRATVWRRGRFAAGDPDELEIVVPALARLRIEASFAYELSGTGGAVDLEALHPGPLEIVLVRDDGRRYGLSLRIEPGDDRAVTLRG